MREQLKAYQQNLPMKKDNNIERRTAEEIKAEVKKLNSPLKNVTQEVSESVEEVHQEDPQKQTDAGQDQERQENEK